VFTNVLLVDEVNRATPKTQSALLEAMAERQVTVEGVTHPLPAPFLALATQNPVEQAGTFPLPEAQLDRFLFKVMVPFPSEEDLVRIVDRTTGVDTPVATKVCTAAEIVEMQRLARSVPIAPHVAAYAVSVLAATHPDQARAPEIVREYVRYGGSPRGAQALVTAGKILALLEGRFNVAIDDVRAAALPALRHRIILNFEGEAEGITTEAVIRSILDAVPAPSVE
jgi:MoxR-like ATPase